MKRILIVEDNKISSTMMYNKISASINDPVHLANNLQEAIALLDKYKNDFFAAFLDYVLPDAPQGQIIDEVVNRGIASIVFTSTVTDHVRQELWKKGIVDYVIKDSPQSINYLTFILSRLCKNQEIQALIVDDSVFFRTVIKKLLLVHNFQILEAEDGVQALQLVKQHPDIKIIVTDNDMPNMDGFTLTRKLRQRYDWEKLTIIGVTSDSNKMSGARFIKSGANDFIDKNNFISEEFYCRVNQSLENMEKVKLIQKLAATDHLTGLYNRGHFYKTAEKLYASAIRSGRDIAFAIIDIDYFKSINDKYGHDVGDMALKHVTSIISESMQRQSDVIGRFGGEEFVVLADDIQYSDAYIVFNNLRKNIQQSPFRVNENIALELTVSIGVYTLHENNIDDSLSEADKLLYKAKAAGRNRIMINEEPL